MKSLEKFEKMKRIEHPSKKDAEELLEFLEDDLENTEEKEQAKKIAKLIIEVNCFMLSKEKKLHENMCRSLNSLSEKALDKIKGEETIIDGTDKL